MRFGTSWAGDAAGRHQNGFETFKTLPVRPGPLAVGLAGCGLGWKLLFPMVPWMVFTVLILLSLLTFDIWRVIP